jgi:hypothetical protein
VNTITTNAGAPDLDEATPDELLGMLTIEEADIILRDELADGVELTLGESVYSKRRNGRAAADVRRSCTAVALINGEGRPIIYRQGGDWHTVIADLMAAAAAAGMGK